jgi:hypothetical protein
MIIRDVAKHVFLFNSNSRNIERVSGMCAKELKLGTPAVLKKELSIVIFPWHAFPSLRF